MLLLGRGRLVGAACEEPLTGKPSTAGNGYEYHYIFWNHQVW